MAVISEDFIRCSACGYPEFEKREVVTIPKGVKREDKTISYPALETTVSYNCVVCGKEHE